MWIKGETDDRGVVGAQGQTIGLGEQQMKVIPKA
jgi:hypothetical protein